MKIGLPLDPTSATEALKEWYEYWRKFRGKRVRFILKTVAKVGEKLGELELWREIIEGTIEAVQKYPPGFILKDSEQFVRHERNYGMYVINKAEPREWMRYTADSDKREKYAKNSFLLILSKQLNLYENLIVAAH